MDLIAFKFPSRSAHALLRATVLAALAASAASLPTVASAAAGRDARPAASHASTYRATPVRSANAYHRASYPRYGYYGWRPGYYGVGYRGGYYGSRYWYGWGPAIGVTVPLLPLGYTSLWIGGTPYYYANDVYYVRGVNGYRVVEPPIVDDVTWHDTPREPASGGFSAPTPSYAKPAAPAAVPTPTDELSITPRNNQSATQRSFDRIDCERAAITQTGYDPSAGGEALRKAEYVRNVSACLEGKGYTVK